MAYKHNYLLCSFCSSVVFWLCIAAQAVVSALPATETAYRQLKIRQHEVPKMKNIKEY